MCGFKLFIACKDSGLARRQIKPYAPRVCEKFCLAMSSVQFHRRARRVWGLNSFSARANSRTLARVLVGSFAVPHRRVKIITARHLIIRIEKHYDVAGGVLEGKSFTFLHVLAVIFEDHRAIFFPISRVRSIECASVRMISTLSRGYVCRAMDARQFSRIASAFSVGMMTLMQERFSGPDIIR